MKYKAIVRTKKKIAMTFTKLTLSAISALALTPIALAGTLSFTIDGVEARGGDLYIGVQTEAQFMKDDGIEGTVIENPKAGSHTVTFDLPDGEYSVSVWHDDDGDGVFERTDTGMPKEGWAMINSASLRGAPTFDQIKISVTDAGASVSETMTYHD